METLIHAAETMSRHLWSVSWQAALLVVIIWIIDRLSFRASSLFRYWLWCIVLFRLCIPLNLKVPAGLDGFIRQGIEKVTQGLREFLPLYDFQGELRSLSVTLVQGEPVHDTGAVTAQKEKAAMMTAGHVCGFAWLTAVMLISILILARIVRVKRILNRCVPIQRDDLHTLVRRLSSQMGIKRTVSLYAVNNSTLGVPAVMGMLRPSILLPRTIAEQWTPGDSEPVLIHELAHVKRHDLLVNWIQVIVQAVYFYHPLVWYANRKIRILREEVCDDIALNRLSMGRKHYSLSILRVMEETAKEPLIGFAGFGFSEKKHSLRERIKRVMNKKYRNITKLTGFSVIALVLAGTLGISLSCQHSSPEGNIPETNSSTQKTADALKVFLTDQQLLHIKYALANPNYPKDYTFGLTIGVAAGKELQPSPELVSGAENITEAVNRYTKIDAVFENNVVLDSPLLSETPVIFITSDRAFSLTHAEAENLGKYLRSGGFAIIDNGSPESGETGASMRQMLRDALGNDAKYLPITKDHRVFHSFFDFMDGPPMGVMYKPTLEGVWIGNRLAAIYSGVGFGHKWKDGVESEPQVKFGLNMVIYGFLQEDRTIRDEFLTKPLPLIKTVNITLKIKEDGNYEVDGVPVTSENLEKVLKEKIGNGIRDYVNAQVRISTSPNISNDRFNETMHRVFEAGASGVRWEQ